MIIAVSALAANPALMTAALARGRATVVPEPTQRTAPSPSKPSTGPSRTSHCEVMTLAALDALVSAPFPPRPAYLRCGLRLALDPSRWILTGKETREKFAALLADKADPSLKLEVRFEAVGQRLKLVRSIKPV